MAQDVAQLSIQVDSSSANQANSALQGLGNTSQWLEGLIGKLAAAFAALKLAEYAKDSILLAARYETLGVAMQVVGANAGYTAKQMNTFEEALERTGISMVESRNNLARMAAAQLDLNKAADLARGAQDAAVIAGINSSEAFERIVQGIVSGQPRILHTMGLFANFSVAEKQWAEEHGRTAASLSNLEKIQIRQDETLKEMTQRAGAYEAAMGTAGKQIFSMQRYLEDFQVVSGAAFGPALTLVIFQMADGLKAASQWVKDNDQQMGHLAGTIKDTILEVEGMIGAVNRMSTGLGTAGNSLMFVQRTFEGIGFVIALITDLIGTLNYDLSSMQIQLTKDLALSLQVVAAANAAIGNKAGANQANNAAGALSNGVGALEARRDSMYTGAVAKWADSIERNNLDAIVRKTQVLTAEQEKARIEAGALKRAMDEKAQADREAAAAAADHAQKIADFRQKLVDESAQLGFNHSQQLAYEASKLGMGKADAAFVAGKIREIQAFADAAEAFKRESDAIKADSRTTETQLAAVLKLDEEYQALTATAREVATWKADDLGLTRDQTEKYVQLTLAIQAKRKAMADEQQLANEAKRITDQNKTPEERAVEQLARLKVMVDGGLLSLEAYNREWIRLQQQAGTAAGMAADAWEVSVNGMNTAFANFVTTGKFSFKSLVASILADLAKLEANKAFASLLSMGLGYLTGSFSGDTVSAAGNSGWTSNDLGNLPGGTVAPGGGSMAGSYSPPPKAAGAASVQTSITINVTDGKATSDSKGAGPNGADLGRLIGAKVREVIQVEMRPAGLLNPVGG